MEYTYTRQPHLRYTCIGQAKTKTANYGRTVPTLYSIDEHVSEIFFKVVQAQLKHDSFLWNTYYMRSYAACVPHLRFFDHSDTY